MDGGGMSPSMIGGIAGSVLGNALMLYGYYSAKKNKKQIEELEKNAPVYTRPGEVKQMLELYKTQAGSTNLPGQSQYEQNIQQATQSGIRNIESLTESPTASLGSIADLYRQEMNAYGNLAIQQEAYYDERQQELGRALSEAARYSDVEFEYNINAPWQRKMQSKINEYISNRNIMQQGMAGWFNAASTFGGTQGSARPISEPAQSYTQTPFTSSDYYGGMNKMMSESNIGLQQQQVLTPLSQ